MNLEGHAVPLTNITRRQRDEMFTLMCDHYDHMRRAEFDSDLDEKSWVVLVTNPQRRVQGFSTQMLLKVNVDGEQITALFSGDTIVHRDLWGQNPLCQVWGRFALSLIDEFSGEPLYWFLISKGYKTYRFLPVFFRDFYPTFQRPTPQREAAIITALGQTKFPKMFDVECGLVRAADAGCCLKPGIADITSERRRDPHVAYFEFRNPGHEHGDELCCLAPLSRENFTTAAYRVMALGCGPDIPVRESRAKPRIPDRNVRATIK